MECPSLLTSGRIAATVGVPLTRVQYVLRTRSIEPVARAGNIRLFDRAAIEAVANALAEIDGLDEWPLPHPAEQLVVMAARAFRAGNRAEADRLLQRVHREHRLPLMLGLREEAA